MKALNPLQRPGIIWCVLFVLIFSGPPKFRVREGGAGVTEGLDLALMIQIGVFIAVGFYLLLEGRKIHLDLTQKLAVVLLGTFFISAIHSEYPAYTIFRAYQATVLFWFSASFVERFGGREHARWLLWAGIVTCLLILLCIPLNPDAVLEYSETGFPRLRGIGVASTGELASLLFVVSMAYRHTLRWLFVSLSATLAFFSLSRSAWLSVALVMGMVALWRPKVWSLRLSKVAIVGTALFALFANASGFVENFREPPESIVDLTGRPVIWATVADAVWTGSRWIGYGHSAASRVLTWDLDPGLGSAHSIFMDAFAGSGLVGLGITLVLALSVAVGCWKVSRLRKTPDVFAVCALSAVAVVLGFIGGDVDSGPFAFVYWALPTLVSKLSVQQTYEKSMVHSRPSRKGLAKVMKPTRAADEDRNFVGRAEPATEDR
jgi:O-antigen ligase